MSRSPVPTSRGRLRARWLLAALIAPACLYDSSDRCGDHQVLQDDQCVCEAGYGLVDQQCVACKDDEVSNPIGPCDCAEGLVRVAEGAECTEAVGQACTTDADCPSPDFPHCQLDGATGYCTSTGCVAGAGDCPGAYGCNDRVTPSFCERPPEGLGASCTTSDDCAGSVASYCEALSAHACLVPGCAADPSICHGDWVCCDLALISNSLCAPPSELVDGACPAGGTLVPR